MPRRKARLRIQTGASDHDIEVLRRAIRDGFPWLSHTADNKFCHTGLTIPQSILLSYVTGIVAGGGVFLSGEAHPSKETVAAVKADLQSDINEAEKRFEGIFIGARHEDGFFRHCGPLEPKRTEF